MFGRGEDLGDRVGGCGSEALDRVGCVWGGGGLKISMNLRYGFGCPGPAVWQTGCIGLGTVAIWLFRKSCIEERGASVAEGTCIL